MDLVEMAAVLEASGEYRVLRKLRPMVSAARPIFASAYSLMWKRQV